MRKMPGSVSSKIAVTGRRAEDAVQGVSVDPTLARELDAAPRAREQRLRHVQVRDDPERPRDQRTSKRVPDHLSVHARARERRPSLRLAPSAER